MKVQNQQIMLIFFNHTDNISNIISILIFFVNINNITLLKKNLFKNIIGVIKVSRKSSILLYILKWQELINLILHKIAILSNFGQFNNFFIPWTIRIKGVNSSRISFKFIGFYLNIQTIVP